MQEISTHPRKARQVQLAGECLWFRNSSESLSIAMPISRRKTSHLPRFVLFRLLVGVENLVWSDRWRERNDEPTIVKMPLLPQESRLASNTVKCHVQFTSSTHHKLFRKHSTTALAKTKAMWQSNVIKISRHFVWIFTQGPTLPSLLTVTCQENCNAWRFLRRPESRNDNRWAEHLGNCN